MPKRGTNIADELVASMSEAAAILRKELVQAVVRSLEGRVIRPGLQT